MIEKYIISLELAKRMKELGWKKENEFYWWKNLNNKGKIWQIEYHEPLFGKTIKAPLFAEIWEELPRKIQYHYEDCYLRLEKHPQNGYDILYRNDYKVRGFWKNNPAEATGEMWCWLKEDGYINEEH